MSRDLHNAAPHGGGSSRTSVSTWAILLAVATALGIVPAAAQTLPRKDLAQCIEIALQQHPDLKAAAATVDVGRARTWEAISTALPQVNADYSASRRHSSVSSRTSGPGGPTGQISNRAQTFDFYSTGFSLSQILFDFGQSLNAIRAARATEHSLEANASTTRETVVFDVKQSYFTLLTAKRLLVVADENVVQDQKHVDLAQGRLDVGVATRFDVTQAQVQLANGELAQVTARNNVAVAIETLRNSLGLVGPLDFDIVDTLDIHDVRLAEEKALGLAYDHRPELLSQRFQEDSVSEQIAALQKNYLPNVTGDASYIWSGDNYPLQSSWNIGATVNVSLFNGGATTAQIGEARATLANLKYQEQSLRQQIALQVRQSVLNLALAHESIRVSEKGLQQARENVELAEGRYKTGVGNIIELTDAQAAFTVAEGANVQALSNYKTAVAALEQATAQSLGEETSEPVATPAPTP
jgi:outer membrane protein